MASKAVVESKSAVIDVHKDADILAAAARLAGEDLCSIADLSTPRSAPSSSSVTTSNAIPANIAMRSTPSRWC